MAHSPQVALDKGKGHHGQRYTLLGTHMSPKKGTFEGDVPGPPKVEYVWIFQFPEGYDVKRCFYVSRKKHGKQHSSNASRLDTSSDE